MKKLSFLILITIFFSFFNLPQTARAGVLSKAPNNLGLVGYWPLNEGNGSVAGDFSGNGKTGSLVNSPTWTDGKRSKALQLSNPSNNGSYVSVANFDYNVMRPGQETASWTMAAWAKQVGSNGNEYVVIGRDGCNGGIYTWNGGYAFAIKTDACWTNAQTIAYTPSNMAAWHHLVAVYNNRAMTFYVDGNSVGTATFSSPMNGYNTTLGVGSGGSSYYAFNGVVDEARVYNRALSAPEVTALYQAGSVIQKSTNKTGLVGYWPMNEGNGTMVGDFSGKGNNGTLSGTTTPTWVNGRHGKALSFDGISNHVVIPYNSSMDLSGNNETLLLWVKHNNNSNIVFQSSGWSRRLFGSSWTLIDNSSNYYTLSASGSTDNKWHQVGYTVAGKTITSYVDGAVAQTLTMADFMRSGNGDWWLGRVCGGSSCESYYSGLVDEVRLYNRALSAPEIQSLYQTGEVAMNASQNNKLTNGLVGLWSFNGADVSGINIYDRSGNGNNGTTTSISTTIGKVGQALAFDGTNSVISVPDSASLNFTGQVTLSIWVKTNGTNNYSGLIQKSNSANVGYQVGFNTGNTIRFDLYNGAGYTVANNSTNLADGLWHLVTATYDGTNAIVYVDGVSGGASNIGAGYVTVSNVPLLIGNDRCCGNGRHFNGVLDEARVYNRALTAAEVKQLYMMGK